MVGIIICALIAAFAIGLFIWLSLDWANGDTGYNPAAPRPQEGPDDDLRHYGG